MKNSNLKSTTKDKFIAIIPCYEPPKAVIEYCKSLINNGIDDVIIVNDGSNSTYNDVFSCLKKFCTVLEYKENKGKGFALKHAFLYCKQTFNKNDCFVTCDCDGQHAYNDVLNCVKTSKDNTNALILGVRDFSKNGVPKRSKFGNNSTKTLFKLLYKTKISDTQTGLRAFSYSQLDYLLKISGNRFEYEMNTLVQYAKGNKKIIEVKIETIYNKKQDDVKKRSHFKTFSDSIKVWGVLFKNLF
ncbi:MAG: glycosyltransferase family 2 protein [Clostridia bacterium]|nr:glycosyltransferase family 2 protein [Clostridia bacterium]